MFVFEKGVIFQIGGSASSSSAITLKHACAETYTHPLDLHFCSAGECKQVFFVAVQTRPPGDGIESQICCLRVTVGTEGHDNEKVERVATIRIRKCFEDYDCLAIRLCPCVSWCLVRVCLFFLFVSQASSDKRPTSARTTSSCMSTGCVCFSPAVRRRDARARVQFC